MGDSHTHLVVGENHIHLVGVSDTNSVVGDSHVQSMVRDSHTHLVAGDSHIHIQWWAGGLAPVPSVQTEQGRLKTKPKYHQGWPRQGRAAVLLVDIVWQ